jgi:hypothetical protein
VIVLVETALDKFTESQRRTSFVTRPAGPGIGRTLYSKVITACMVVDVADVPATKIKSPRASATAPPLSVIGQTLGTAQR